MSDRFNHQETSTPFPYHELDDEEKTETDPSMSEAVRMLSLIMDFIGGGNTLSDMGMRFLVVQYVTRPDIYDFKKIDDLAAYSPKGVGRAAVHRLIQNFESLTGFKSILSMEKDSHSAE
jgi:hypothetical protein